MQVFVQHRYQGQDLCVLNCCRMFLQAIWVSDISNGTGKEILKEAWNGTKKMESSYQWPRSSEVLRLEFVAMSFAALSWARLLEIVESTFREMVPIQGWVVL